MSVSRRGSPRAFKGEAADRIETTGLLTGAVAGASGLHETVLRRWMMRLGTQAARSGQLWRERDLPAGRRTPAGAPGRGRRRFGAALAALAALAAPPAVAAPDSLLGAFGDPLTLVHMYAGPDGRSHVREATIPAKALPNGFTSLFDDSAVRARIAHVPDGHYGDYHNAIPRHLTLLLQGEYVLFFGNDESYRLKPGMLLFAEDMTGRGHADRCEAKSGARVCVLLVIDPANSARSVPVSPKPAAK